MEKWAGSKLGKEYVKAVYCHPAYLNLCRGHHSGLDESETGIKISRKTSTSALLTTPKTLAMWITINYGKFLKRWEYQTT